MRLRSLTLALAAATAVSAPAAAQEALAEITGLPEGPVLDVVRRAVGEVEEPAPNMFEARRRAERARDRALAALRSEGYYGARIEARAEPGEPLRARLEISPGPLFVLGSVGVRLEGDAAAELTDSATAAAALAPGAPARAEDVIAAEARAVAVVIAAGYPDAHALDRVITVDHAREEMDVILRVDMGRAAVFGPVVAVGTGRVRQRYLERLAPFSPGDRYEPGVLDTLAERLRETGAYASVATRLQPPTDSGPGPAMRTVVAEVEARPRRTLTLGAAYSTTEGGGVDAEWVRRNLRGGGEELTVSAAAYTLERDLGVELAAPHWRRPGRTLRLNAGVSDETTDAFDRFAAEGGAGIEQRLSPRMSLALGLGATLSEVTDEDSVERFVLGFASGSIAWDGANDPLDPTRGVRASLLARPTAGAGDGPLAYLVADSRLSAYQPLAGERLVAAARARSAAVVGPALSELPADERFFAGGGGSVRGYEYQSLSPRNADGELIGGRSLVELSAELRYRGQGRFGYAAFLDGGVASEELSPDLADMRWGAGLGLRYYAPVGPIRLDLAAPLDPRDDDEPVQFYFSIGQAY